MAFMTVSDSSVPDLESTHPHLTPSGYCCSPITRRSNWVNPFSWPQRFFGKQLIAKGWENLPRATTRIQAADENEDINFLLNTEEEWASNKSHIDAVLDIFCGQTLLELQSPTARILNDQKRALLIDGNNGTTGSYLRPFAGALSPRELLMELRKKRYEETSIENTLELEDGSKLDAERRLIFVENLDSWSILALAGSAPESLSRALGDLIANHVCSKSSIRVSFSTSGPPIFALHFDIPYRVWRSSKSLKLDSRLKKSLQEPLRSSRDVTFLRMQANKSDVNQIDGIYASQISCLVTGYDNWRWTALAFAETWFEEVSTNDPTPDMVTRYEYDFEDGFLTDPLCRGRYDVAQNGWDPRGYFVRVLEIRLVQICREWASVISNLEIRFRSLATIHRQTLRMMQDAGNHSGSTSVQIDHALQAFGDTQDRVSNAKDLLDDISLDLQETVRSGSSFMGTDVNYFLHNDGSPGDGLDCLPHISQIRGVFNDLRHMQQWLGDWKQKYKEMLEDGFSSRKTYLLQLNAKSQKQTVPGPSVSIDRTTTTADIWTCALKISLPYLWCLSILLNPSDLFSSQTMQRSFLVICAMGVLSLIFCWGRVLHRRSFAKPTQNRNIDIGASQLGVEGIRTGNTGKTNKFMAKLYSVMRSLQLLGPKHQNQVQLQDLERGLPKDSGPCKSCDGLAPI